jgi:hypothetical protein
MSIIIAVIQMTRRVPRSACTPRGGRRRGAFLLAYRSSLASGFRQGAQTPDTEAGLAGEAAEFEAG